jgi:hypothetical protein
LLIGTLLGLALGLSTTIPREEKLRHVFAYLFGGMAIAAIGGGFYFFSETQLEFLSLFLFSFLLVFIVTFLSGLRYRKWRDSPFAALVDMHTPDEIETRQVQRHIPKVKANIEWRGNIVFGFKIAVMFEIQNNTEINLDRLDATLTITYPTLRREKTFIHKDLSDMFPREKASYCIEAKIGRKVYPMNVMFRVRRQRVVLEEFHFTPKEQTEEQ